MQPNLELAAELGKGTPYGISNVGGGAIAPYQDAIAKTESGGNYAALGPVTSSGDRAYGKYQVMGANIPQWTQAALGKSMTPQQFLADPQAQDAVFNHQFGGYVQKFGPQNAASMWLTGRTLANGGAGAADQNGTTGQAYADQFKRNLGAAPASAAISAATAPHVPTWAEVQGDNAAGSKAINAATAAGNGALPGASAYAPGAVDRLSPDAAASPLARPAVPPAPTPTPLTGTALSGHPTENPSKAISPSDATAPTGSAPQQFRPDVQNLLNTLSDTWATPAQQQIAQSLLQSQMPGVPQAMTIKDADGSEHVVFVNPRTQSVTTPQGQPQSPLNSANAGGPLPAPAVGSSAPPAPAPGPAALGGNVPQTLSGAINMASANGMTPQGAAYLNGMETQGGPNAEVARQARAIINGQTPMPEGSAATKPIDIAVRDAVLRAAPGFNSSLAAARVDLVKSFGDKTASTSAGGMIVSANAALHHLSALADSADEVNNSGRGWSGPPAWNWIGNHAYEATTGFPALKAYDFNKNALADEVAKIYKGGTPAEGEIKAMLASLSPNMTPAEQKAVFGKVSTLLQGKTDELQRQWQTAFGPNSSYPVIGQEGQSIIKRFANGASTSQASGTKAPPAVGAVEQGHRFLGGDPANPASWQAVQ